MSRNWVPMSDLRRIRSVTHRPLPLGGCRCSTVDGEPYRVFTDCPEHGLVARLTPRQWELLGAVDASTAAEALQIAYQIPRDLCWIDWGRDDVIPVWVIGVGRRWTVALRRNGLPPCDARTTELTFGTVTGGFCALDVPVVQPVPCELVDTPVVLSKASVDERCS